MKKITPFWILSIAASLILSTGLLAQDQIEMSIKVKKDGKLVKDTTYLFDDADEAKHAMKMMELISGDEPHMKHVTYNYTTAHTGSGEAKTMVFISKDGETTEIKEFHGDSLVWVTEEEVDGKHAHGNKVIVMKSEDGNTFDILVDVDYECGDVVKKKKVKVVVSGDEEVKVNVIKIMEEEGEGENVKVIVITESGDLHEVHDHYVDSDHDKDSDHDEEVEVEVEVVKKKVKK